MGKNSLKNVKINRENVKIAERTSKIAEETSKIAGKKRLKTAESGSEVAKNGLIWGDLTSSGPQL